MKFYAVLIGLSIPIGFLACSDPAQFTTSSSSSSSGAGGAGPQPCAPGDEAPCICPNADWSTQICEAPGAWGPCKGCPTASSSSSSGSSSSSSSSGAGGSGGAPCNPMSTADACSAAGATCGMAPDGCGSSVSCGVCGPDLCYQGACCAPIHSCAGRCSIHGAAENCGVEIECDDFCDGAMKCDPAANICKCLAGNPAIMDLVNCTAERPWLWSCGAAPNADLDGFGCVFIGGEGWCCAVPKP